MAEQENVEHLKDCYTSKIMGSWTFTVVGGLLAIPVGIKRQSVLPLVFAGITCTMLDISTGIRACNREYAERQMKLLEAKNAAAESQTDF